MLNFALKMKCKKAAIGILTSGANHPIRGEIFIKFTLKKTENTKPTFIRKKQKGNHTKDQTMFDFIVNLTLAQDELARLDSLFRHRDEDHLLHSVLLRLPLHPLLHHFHQRLLLLNDYKMTPNVNNLF